ncbi:MAG: nucleotidyl transferase AbiEii/AbiGii toxin family protein [Actinobacteria bacterium]|nr:nucleotidyl transferase AbiEii/AbiGii toxin family protein [Actinomycetota bacterium]
MAEVLSMLDAPLLAEHNCWFGGGTALVLANGEFRESVDIDFLVSDQRSYRQLRQMVRDQGLDVLATRELTLARAPVVDGYGIRASLLVAGVAIKFEVIHEGRIALDTPSTDDEVHGVRILTRTDQVATKLLANDDRWADTSAFSRDLIDLAMMRPDRVALTAGARKAVRAYGVTLGQSFDKAVTFLGERPERLEVCLRALKVDVPRAVVWQRIRDLSLRSERLDIFAQGGE